MTGPDARSMSSRGTGIVGYNVQAAVDTEHHLIVAHEVTNQGSDRCFLSVMAKKARAAMGIEELEVVADRGYTMVRRSRRAKRPELRFMCPNPAHHATGHGAFTIKVTFVISHGRIPIVARQARP